MKKKIKLENHPSELEYLNYICGIDESGRGCLSGPVFAAAVILPKDFESELIRDSKKLSEKKRIEAFELIKKVAISWGYSFVEPDVVDKINIQEATYLAMINSVNKLNVKPEHLLVDGNRFTDELGIPYTCVIKGDNKYLSIAAASIVAKVLRDNYMVDLHKQYPKYKWDSNKGYGSKEHIQKIQTEGVTEHHRKSFLKNILKN
jgi:ribonuclease HII